VCELVRDAGEFGEAQNPWILLAGQIANRYIAPEGKQMVFAQGGDTHPADNDHLIRLNRLKGSSGIAGVVVDKLLPPVCPAARRIYQSGPRRVFPNGNEDLPAEVF